METQLSFNFFEVLQSDGRDHQMREYAREVLKLPNAAAGIRKYGKYEFIRMFKNSKYNT